MKTIDKHRIADAFNSGCRSLMAFSNAHRSMYGENIANDGVLGECWLEMARGLLGMLNGELGDLDGATLDAQIRDIAESAGFTRDLGFPK